MSKDLDEPTEEEIIKRIKFYHQLQERRKEKSYFEDFVDDGHTLEFRASITPWGGRKPGNWWTGEDGKRKKKIEAGVGLERSEKSKFREYSQNLKQIELEKERKEKAEKVLRLTEAYRVKNVTKLKPSKTVEHDEFMKDELYDTVKTPTDKTMVNPFSESCRIRLKLVDGKIEIVEFQTEDLIERILEYCVSQYGKPKNDETYLTGIALQRKYPPKVFTNEEVSSLTIKAAGLINGNVNIIRKGGGYQMKDKPKYENYKEEMLPKWRLKGDAHEDKMKYREKIRKRKVQELKEDRKRKKETLRKVRLQIREDKRRRKEMKRRKRERERDNAPKKNEKKVEEESPQSIIGDTCTIQIRVDGGQRIVHTFSKDDTFLDIETVLVAKIGLNRVDQYSFVIPYPRRTIEKFMFSDVKLGDCKSLFPKGTLVLNRPKADVV